MITNHLLLCTSVKTLWLDEWLFAEKDRESFVLADIWADKDWGHSPGKLLGIFVKFSVLIKIQCTVYNSCHIQFNHNC